MMWDSIGLQVKCVISLFDVGETHLKLILIFNF